MLQAAHAYANDPLKSATDAALVTQLVGPEVVLTTMRGRVRAAHAYAGAHDFRRALVQTTKPSWVINQLALTGFDATAVTAGARWFEEFRAHLGREIVFVSALASARMVAASLAFSVRVKIVAVPTMAEAFAHVDPARALHG